MYLISAHRSNTKNSVTLFGGVLKVRVRLVDALG